MKRECILVVAMMISSGATAALAREPYNEAARIEDAKQLIEANRQYIKDSQRLHKQLQETILVAQRLQGKATNLQINTTGGSISPHLTGERLAKANAQFAADVQQFKVHAADYDNHLKQFRTTIGECKANEERYKAQVARFQIHAQRFHMPNIRPPHICGSVDLSMFNITTMANQIRADEQGVAEAEGRLQDSLKDLGGERKQTAGLQGQVLNENRRALAEQKLADEFTRLRGEYETLEIEHRALGGKPVAATTTSVTGTIKSKAKAK